MNIYWGTSTRPKPSTRWSPGMRRMHRFYSRVHWPVENRRRDVSRPAAFWRRPGARLRGKASQQKPRPDG